MDPQALREEIGLMPTLELQQVLQGMQVDASVRGLLRVCVCLGGGGAWWRGAAGHASGCIGAWAAGVHVCKGSGGVRGAEVLQGMHVGAWAAHGSCRLALLKFACHTVRLAWLLMLLWACHCQEECPQCAWHMCV